jgi:hypothetical protein
MPKIKLNFDIVRDIGLKLPGVEETTAYGAPALKVQGKLLACVPSNRSAEPESLVVRVDFDDRAELLAADPDVYYLTDHYVGYSAVLVRLSRLTPDKLRDLLGMARKFVTPKAATPGVGAEAPLMEPPISAAAPRLSQASSDRLRRDPDCGRALPSLDRQGRSGWPPRP